MLLEIIKGSWTRQGRGWNARGGKNYGRSPGTASDAKGAALQVAFRLESEVEGTCIS